MGLSVLRLAASLPPVEAEGHLALPAKLCDNYASERCRKCFPGVFLPMLLWPLVCQAGQVASKEVLLERG